MKKSAAYLNIVTVVASLFLLVAFASAQEQTFMAAEKLFEKGEYYSAAKLYERYLQSSSVKGFTKEYKPYVVNHKENVSKAGNKNIPNAHFRIAESYRLANDYQLAEKWYKACLEKYPSRFPLTNYGYGICLRANKNYASAETAFKSFIATYDKADAYIVDAKRELDNLSFISAALSKAYSETYEISKLPIPSEGGSFGAGFADDNTLVYTSTYTDESASTANKNPYSNRLYNFSVSGANVQTATPFNIDGIAFNTGAASFLATKGTMFFTQWEKIDGRITTALYSATKDGNQWSKPAKIAALNLDGFNAMQPSVNAEGTHLFFSSNRPGGVGGYDIWYALLDANGNLSAPMNAGKQINSEADEKSPWYSSTLQQLIFSTNVRTGFGGFDFFVADETSAGIWSNPVNMGLPFNSSKDDVYFFARENKSGQFETYISSDRESECCLELFRLEKSNHSNMVSGVLLDCRNFQPIAGGMVKLNRGISEPTDSTTTDDSGNFIFKIGKEDSIIITGMSEGYELSRMKLCLPKGLNEKFNNDSSIRVQICVSKPETQNKAVSENENEKLQSVVEENNILYFDFDRASLSGASKEKLEAVVKKLKEDPSLMVEIGGYTDVQGSDEYNLDLGYKRAKAAANYLIAAGIDIKRLTLKSYGECCPVEKPDEPSEKNKLDRKVKFIFSLRTN